MSYPPQGFIDSVSRKEIIGLKREAKRWKIIAIVLFFIGIGMDRLLSILLLS